MKFMAKTTMKTATFRDMALASTQGTLVEVPLDALSDGSYFSSSSSSSSANIAGIFGTVCLFLVSTFILCCGIYLVRKAQKNTNYEPKFNMDQPFVFT